MLMVVGLLVYALIQRQVRLYLHDQRQSLPGNKGLTATPTAAVLLTLFSPVLLIQLIRDTPPVLHLYGVQPSHLLVCDALGIDRGWSTAPSHQEKRACTVYPLEREKCRCKTIHKINLLYAPLTIPLVYVISIGSNDYHVWRCHDQEAKRGETGWPSHHEAW